MKRYTYVGVVKKGNDEEWNGEYIIEFPDIEGCFTSTPFKGIVNCYAQDIVELCLLGAYKDNNKDYPEPKFTEEDVKDGGEIIYVTTSDIRLDKVDKESREKAKEENEKSEEQKDKEADLKSTRYSFIEDIYKMDLKSFEKYKDISLNGIFKTYDYCKEMTDKLINTINHISNNGDIKIKE